MADDANKIVLGGSINEVQATNGGPAVTRYGAVAPDWAIARALPTSRPNGNNAPIAHLEPLMYLMTALDMRRNSLNALRLVLAMLVIVSHAPMVADGGAAYHWGDLEIGGWAVAGFFAISGWLITTSRQRLDLRTYLWRRCARIYPAFWAALLVTAFVFAPLAASIHGSWRPASAVAYVVTNSTLHIQHGGIPGTLTDAPFPLMWNLSLWTLFWEFSCYVAMGLLLAWTFARTHRWVTFAAFAATALANGLLRALEVPISDGVQAGLRLGSFFLAGAVLCRYGDRIRADWRIAGSCIAVVVFTGMTGVAGIYAALPLAYLVIYAGARLPLHRIGSRNDISYGVYVYAFPVAQLLALRRVDDLGIPVFVLVTLVMVLPLAWASWAWVERPAQLAARSYRRGRSSSGIPVVAEQAST